MKYFKITVSIIAVMIVGMYGWYLFATVVNKQADHAAAVIILDTFSSTNAHDIKKLNNIKKFVVEGEAVKAISLIEKSIDDKLSMLEGCVTEKCNEFNSEFNAK